MNILHLKYAVEVARCGSINKAAEALYMNQPNLSRAIKDLENSLGITIFGRTAKGMYVTPEGEEFLGYARKILRQIDEVESIYKAGVPIKQRFSISVPRASYISEAFAQFSKSLTNEPAELFYKETNARRVITNILKADYHLGILRYASNYDKYFKEMLTEKGLVLAGTSPDNRLVEIIELPAHPWFVGVQFHPEFKSRPNKAHPLFRDFVGAAKKYHNR